MGDDREVAALSDVAWSPGAGAARTAALKRARSGVRISVCLPARDEEATIGTIVSSISRELTAESGGVDLVDEILVVDDGSRDATGRIARSAGARVVATAPGSAGKGQAMRVALERSEGEVVVFLDADVRSFGTHYVTELVGPLLADEGVALVKGFYERPLEGRPGEGGRVTELVARPAIDLLFPHLEGIRQPLAGESAAWRSVLDKVGLADGYGVELALLVDVADHFGVGSIAQADLGVRVHRNRPLSELRHQATEVLRVALERAAVRDAPRSGSRADQAGTTRHELGPGSAGAPRRSPGRSERGRP
jgi:glucosyl-3-phosphoglycerate synthase